jgi:hypothetical protein
MEAASGDFPQRGLIMETPFADMRMVHWLIQRALLPQASSPQIFFL